MKNNIYATDKEESGRCVVEGHKDDKRGRTESCCDKNEIGSSVKSVSKRERPKELQRCNRSLRKIRSL